jgi:hypothetical protein
MKTKHEPADLADFLRRLAGAVETMTASDLEDFLHGLKSPRRTLKTGGNFGAPNTKRSQIISENVAAEILGRLQAAQSTEEGFRILREFDLTRRDLIEIARARSVHIVKEDSVPRIEEKLVEAVIGSRLNSQAIRGSRQSS